MGRTSIQWADHSINPIRARLGTGNGHFCQKVSPGCKHCYASSLQRRFKMPEFTEQGRIGPKLYLDESKLEEVLRRRKPTRYFWCDMTDLFGSWVPDEWLDRCFATMALTPQHTHLVLTKRPERMLRYLTESVEARWGSSELPPRRDCAVWAAARRQLAGTGKDIYREIEMPAHGVGPAGVGIKAWPLPNVWLGCSVEDQARADERIPLLLQTPAAVRFLSVEPLLGPVDLRSRLTCVETTTIGGILDESIARAIDWVIVGGESGPGARPCDVAWIRDVVKQCHDAQVPVFVKQLGARPFECVENIGDAAPGAGLWGAADRWLWDDSAEEFLYQPADPKGGDPLEWPIDLRVREFPKTEARA